MKNLDGYSLEDFLDLAVRNDYILSYRTETTGITLVLNDGEHHLDERQAWTWVSTTLYDWWQQQALGNEA